MHWYNINVITTFVTNGLLILMNSATFIHVKRGSNYSIILAITALQIGASLFYIVNNVGYAKFLRLDQNNSE